MSLLSAVNVLLLLGILDDQYKACTSSPMWYYYCTLSVNTLHLKDVGRDALQTGSNERLIEYSSVFYIGLIVQLAISFLTWISSLTKLYQDSMLCLFILAHFIGWAHYGIIATEVPDFNTFIDPVLIGSQGSTEFSVGDGPIYTLAGSVLSLAFALSRIVKLYLGV